MLVPSGQVVDVPLIRAFVHVDSVVERKLSGICPGDAARCGELLHIWVCLSYQRDH